MTKKTTKKTTKKVEQVVAAPVTIPTAVHQHQSAHSVKTEAEKIWEEIHLLPIEMFALPNQIVSQHCEPLSFAVDPNRLFLTIRSTATLPSLETSLNTHSALTKAHAIEMAKRGHVVEVKEYTVELADKFVIVSRAAVLPLVGLTKNR